VSARNLAPDISELALDVCGQAFQVLGHPRGTAIELSVESGRAVVDRSIDLIANAVELSFETRNRVLETLSVRNNRVHIGIDDNRAMHVVFETAARQDDEADHERIHPEAMPPATSPSARIAVPVGSARGHRRQATNGDTDESNERKGRPKKSHDAVD
jgi:hypothetical protein